MSRENNGQDNTYWRSLNQLAETEEYKEFLHREFPEGASKLSDDMSRRTFVSLMGASMAMAGLVSCRKPVEKIIPYVQQPEEIIPGESLQYATTMPFQNSAYGLLVESHEGRPTKVEGNEMHPSSLGKSNVFAQGTTLDLYDPDRSDTIRRQGSERTYQNFITFWREQFTKFLDDRGRGLAIVAEANASPTITRLYRKFRRNFPLADWVVYEPVSNENIYRGIELASGTPYQPVFHMDEADVVLTLDADFVMRDNENIMNAKKFADRRRVKSELDSMNRLYAAESTYTLTGGMADHRMCIQSRKIGTFVQALTKELQNLGVQIPGVTMPSGTEYDLDMYWISALAKDLKQNAGNSLIMAGRNQPPVVHALVFALNEALGNNGTTISYTAVSETAMPDRRELTALTESMDQNEVETLVMLGGNPVYNAPADLDFAEKLKSVPHSIHLSSRLDETSTLAEWHVPEAHFLECWGDTFAVDGAQSVIQPLIAPLFNGIARTEFINLIATGEDQKSYDLVQESWRSILGGRNFDQRWKQVIHDGIEKDRPSRTELPEVQPASLREAIRGYTPPADVTSATNLEIVFQPSASVFDGRYANNGWLQELPDPVTKLAWDNAAVMSPNTAGELGVKNEDVVTLDYLGRQMELPVWVVPGYADYTVAVELGYGRTAVGRVGDNVGTNVYQIRTAQSPGFGAGLTLKNTGGTYSLAGTQDHWSLEGRDIYREATLKEYQEHPEFVAHMDHHPPEESLWNEHSYEEGYQWGMAIDLNVCTGCNACTIACQSENNIPIVGKAQVKNGREMHWIRMDRYFSGDIADPEMVVQPVTCMHCENAPCETVCPVNATVHDDEGLNVQIYNRCVGTRYCSNNCPYKVRRFNFFNYTSNTPEVERMGKNPDVTVRSRGVMEKCTYCLQRINKKKIRAKREDRKLYTDEVVSACQQTCPTDAIVFGDINDPESRVSKVKKQNRDYVMLGHLNTQPRTSYQAKLRNPNPALKDRQSEEESAHTLNL